MEKSFPAPHSPSGRNLDKGLGKEMMWGGRVPGKEVQERGEIWQNKRLDSGRRIGAQKGGWGLSDRAKRSREWDFQAKFGQTLLKSLLLKTVGIQGKCWIIKQQQQHIQAQTQEWKISEDENWEGIPVVSRSWSWTSGKGFNSPAGWQVYLQTPLVAGAIVGSLFRATGSGKVPSSINKTKISLPASYLALALGRKSTHMNMIPQACLHGMWAKDLLFMTCKNPKPRR